MGTNFFGDHLSMGTKCLGTICPGGPIVLGTICPGGPNVWGPIVHGDQLSRGPNEPGLFVLGDQLRGTKCPGTECVRDQMRSSQIQLAPLANCQSLTCVTFIAWLITCFGNFVYGFSSLRLRDFLYNVFRLQGKMGNR